LRPYEAVTIVHELAMQVARGEIAGVPSAHVVRLFSHGTVSIEGPVAAGGRPVVRAAQLLDDLLPDAEAGSEFRVPGGLKLVIARALGTLDLPPYGSLEAFAESLVRFAATDPAGAITNLVVSCVEAAGVQPPPAAEEPPPAAAAQVQRFVGARAAEARLHRRHEPLTISDIRRARRATGVPLVKVAERSRIPVGLLRQLEWGYLFNWPKGRYGRTQLVRYARATGLDEELVVSTVTPLIDQAQPVAPPPVAPPLVAPPLVAPPLVAPPLVEKPRESTALAVRSQAPSDLELRPSAAPTLFVAGGTEGRSGRRAAVALAAAAALAILLVPMWWAYPGRPATATAQVAQGGAASTGTTGRSAPAPVAPVPDTPRDSTEVATTSSALPARTEPQRAARNQPDVPTADDQAAAPVPDAEYLPASDSTPYSPTFASAGTAMFYHAEDARGSALVRADTDGEGSILRITRIVDDSANNFHVRPSPDGSRIAFDSDRDGVRGVYVADSEGKGVRRVSGEGFASVPSWSPDGRTLAFVRAEPDRPKVWNLWTLQLESGEMRQITRHRYGAPWGGSWFPDGQRIAYSHEDRLIVHDLNSGAEQVFPTPIKGRLVRTPAVSPDGKRIVFQVYRDGAWLLDYPRGTVRKVLEDPTAEEYTWAPDGKRLAYHSNRSGHWGVWVMASR
jgi:hypothetical protein